MRVRDVEIALVLAREMKAAAERDVDASLRLEQLREVFGAERLDRGERARIQTALQMAGLEPRPSLLDADPEQPIRFALESGTAAATATEAPPAAAPAPEEKPEFPTVGEFFKRRFKGRRGRDGEDDDDVTTVTGLPDPPEPAAGDETIVRATLPGPEPEPESPAGDETVVRATQPEPEPEPVAEEEDPVAEDELHEPELEEEPLVDEYDEEPASLNGHVDAGTNGHAHLDFDDVLPAHETATPADFGASAETVDFEDPRVEEELAHLADEHEGPDPEPELEPEPEPEPVVHHEPAPEPQLAAAQPAEPAQIRPAAIFAAAAVPVVIASLAGWAFGLAFVALGLVAVGLLRHASFRSVLVAGAVVTLASLAVSFVLAGIGDGADDEPPAAQEPEPPAAEQPKDKEPAKEKPEAEEPAREPQPEREQPAAEEPAPREQPKADAPDDDTEGLIRVPPPAEQPQGTAPPQPGTEPAPGGTTP